MKYIKLSLSFIIILALITSCTSGNKNVRDADRMKPSTEEIDKVLQQIYTCLELNVSSLDDDISRAKTIATVLVSVCHDEIESEIKLVSRQLQNNNQKEIFKRDYIPKIRSRNIEKAIGVVLVYREKKREKKEVDKLYYQASNCLKTNVKKIDYGFNEINVAAIHLKNLCKVEIMKMSNHFTKRMSENEKEKFKKEIVDKDFHKLAIDVITAHQKSSKSKKIF
jgi:hypothetical protein